MHSYGRTLRRSMFDRVTISEHGLVQRRFGAVVARLPWAEIKEYGIKQKPTFSFEDSLEETRMPYACMHGTGYYLYFAVHVLSAAERARIGTTKHCTQGAHVIAIEALNYASDTETRKNWAAPFLRKRIQAYLPDFQALCQAYHSDVRGRGICVYHESGRITCTEDVYRLIPGGDQLRKQETAQETVGLWLIAVLVIFVVQTVLVFNK